MLVKLWNRLSFTAGNILLVSWTVHVKIFDIRNTLIYSAVQQHCQKLSKSVLVCRVHPIQSLKVLQFKCCKIKALKVLENEDGPC